MAVVVVSKEARNDLIGIRKYIGEELHNPDAAVRIIDLLRKSVGALSEMPERGTPLDAILSVHTDYRFLVCEKYRVFYLFDGATVEVIRILHQKQDYMSALFFE